MNLQKELDENAFTLSSILLSIQFHIWEIWNPSHSCLNSLKAKYDVTFHHKHSRLTLKHNFLAICLVDLTPLYPSSTSLQIKSQLINRSGVIAHCILFYKAAMKNRALAVITKPLSDIFFLIPYIHYGSGLLPELERKRSSSGNDGLLGVIYLL